MSIEELRELIYEAVEEELGQLFGEPDRGLELREDVKERLRRSLEATDRGETGISPQEVASKTGLEW